MQRQILSVIFLCLAFAMNLVQAEGAALLSLVQNGQSEYQIVLPDEPTAVEQTAVEQTAVEQTAVEQTAVEQTAANELQSYLNKISGVQLPIV